MPAAHSLAAAGRWLLNSGIQEPSGGFARFHDSEKGRNKAVSTEITGYSASALIYLFKISGDEAYLACARKATQFLVNTWDNRLRTFPFEHPSPSPAIDHHSYFFDCGIIIRGLLAVWRETHDDQLLEISRAAAHGMLADFHTGQDYHPILALPDKNPLPRTDQWSRSPGCYQLKAALAWWEVFEATGESALRDAWLEMLNFALATHADFVPGEFPEHRVMDRLHPYCYFLEGLLPALDREDCLKAYQGGIETITRLLRQIAPRFVRSDVYAQLLRARLNGVSVRGLDLANAICEAEALACFQARSEDPRVNGGFFFGRRNGEMSAHVNPVSTIFALQALEMWRQHQTGALPSAGNSPCVRLLI